MIRVAKFKPLQLWFYFCNVTCFQLTQDIEGKKINLSIRNHLNHKK